MPTLTVVRTTANQTPNENKYFLSGNLAKQYKHSIILICIKNEESDTVIFPKEIPGNFCVPSVSN